MAREVLIHDVVDGDETGQPARAGNLQPVGEHAHLDGAPTHAIVAVRHGVDQRLADGGRRVLPLLFAFQTAHHRTHTNFILQDVPGALDDVRQWAGKLHAPPVARIVAFSVDVRAVEAHERQSTTRDKRLRVLAEEEDACYGWRASWEQPPHFYKHVIEWAAERASLALFPPLDEFAQRVGIEIVARRAGNRLGLVFPRGAAGDDLLQLCAGESAIFYARAHEHAAIVQRVQFSAAMHAPHKDERPAGLDLLPTHGNRRAAEPFGLLYDFAELVGIEVAGGCARSRRAIFGSATVISDTAVISDADIERAAVGVGERHQRFSQ